MRSRHNPDLTHHGKNLNLLCRQVHRNLFFLLAMATTHRLFPTTSESLVDQLNAPEQKLRETALAAFCAVYYPPLYGYARAMGFQEADAQDRVQDFFMEVVRRDMLQRYNRDTGSRFSTWLITCFKNLVFNHQAQGRSQKKGGKLQFVEFDATHAEQSYQTSYLTQLDPDPTFDLMLAREIWRMARPAIMALHQGKSSQALVSELLQNVLMDRWPPKPEPSQEEVAARHGTTPTRLKAFFSRTLKAQARRCFDNAGQLASSGISDSELDHLWHLLTHYGEA